MSNCLIAQSGGPTSAINATLSGILEATLNNPDINKTYGSINGIQGVINNNLIILNNFFNSKDKIQTLKTTPSMFLGSCRFKLPDYTKDDTYYKIIFEEFKKYNIKFFFYIGGNDSMDTVDKLSNYATINNIDIKILGIPKTIDNDLYGTDHTPGFGSAAKFIATSILEIAHDTYIYDVSSVTIVEIMGRNAGWLTASSALSRNNYSSSPDLIYLPEVPFSVSNFINHIKKIQQNKRNIIIAVSEGIKDPKGNYISSSEAINDSFGHMKLNGTGKTLEQLVKNTLNCKVRSIELNVLQRSAMHIASLTDIKEASLVGKKAVELACSGLTGKMITIQRIQNSPYKININHINVNEVSNKEKLVPREWINEEGNNVKQDLINYIQPLVIGEVPVKYENGIPKYTKINHLL